MVSIIVVCINIVVVISIIVRPSRAGPSCTCPASCSGGRRPGRAPFIGWSNNHFSNLHFRT